MLVGAARVCALSLVVLCCPGHGGSPSRRDLGHEPLPPSFLSKLDAVFLLGADGSNLSGAALPQTTPHADPGDPLSHAQDATFMTKTPRQLLKITVVYLIRGAPAHTAACGPPYQDRGPPVTEPP